MALPHDELDIEKFENLWAESGVSEMEPYHKFLKKLIGTHVAYINGKIDIITDEQVLYRIQHGDKELLNRFVTLKNQMINRKERKIRKQQRMQTSRV